MGVLCVWNENNERVVFVILALFVIVVVTAGSVAVAVEGGTVEVWSMTVHHLIWTEWVPMVGLEVSPLIFFP